MEILKEIKERISVRNFEKKAIPKEIINRILDAGRVAPSAKNRQPWRFIVVDNEDIKKKIETAAYSQEFVGSAGIIIAACSTNIEYNMPNGQPSYPIDISFAVSFMMLQAQAEGLGSCLTSTYDETKLKNILSVPYSMRVVMLLLIGYSSEELHARDRKMLNTISSYNHW